MSVTAYEHPLAKYIRPSARTTANCPGCGNGILAQSILRAIEELGLTLDDFVFVSGIGCAAWIPSPSFFADVLHTTHGRPIAFGVGIKVALPNKRVMVISGDGDLTAIGGNHLIHAARRNIGMTVLVFNNLNYGMTGGEHSATTPPRAVTASTPYGNLERPMDICATVGVNGANYVARTTSFDSELPELIAEAILNDGFALVDIWELCTAYFVPHNRYSRKALEAEMRALGFASGILYRRAGGEYSRLYREALADPRGQTSLPPRPIAAKYSHRLDTRLSCLIAGSAGQRIGSAARALCRGALLSGLWASERTDYPVTVRSGYSLAEVILSPEEIGYRGVTKPDLLVVLSSEGLAQVRAQLSSLTEAEHLFIETGLLPVETHAQIVPLELRGKVKRQEWSLKAIGRLVETTGIYPLAAFEETLEILDLRTPV